MKAIGGLLMFVAMIINTIIGYVLVTEVLPSWITLWAIGATLTYLGFLFSVFGEAMKT